MSSFVLIDSNVDVSPIMEQIGDVRSIWQDIGNNMAKIVPLAHPLGPTGVVGPGGDNKVLTPFLNDSILPIKIPRTDSETAFPGDIEETETTPLYETYDSVVSWIQSTGISADRVELLYLREGEIIPDHTDDGLYYEKRDRFHLCLFGQYVYTVDGVSNNVEPGMFYWFDNSLVHSASGTTDSLILIFDSLFNDNHPHHNT